MAPTDVDVISTVVGGREATDAIERSPALLGYESSQSRPPPGSTVEFIDYPFRTGGPFGDHLAAVAEHEPRYAVAPDISDPSALDRTIEQADELAGHAETVIVVPKAVEPAVIPDRFRVGLPLANWDFSPDADDEQADPSDPSEWIDQTGNPQFHQWTEYVDLDSVHLLGGSPTIQREVAKYGVPVESVDGSAVFRAAGVGDVWAPTRSRNWHPAHPDEMDYYAIVTASLSNVWEAWNGLGEYALPSDPETYAGPIETAETERDNMAAEARQRAESAIEAIETERDYMAAGARGAPPAIHPDDADLWGPGEIEEMGAELRDFESEIEDAEKAALAALTERFEQQGLSAYNESMSNDTDDSDPYDPTREWSDDRHNKTGPLGEFGIVAEEGTGSDSEEHRRAQNEGYLLSSEQGAVENEREGLGAFGARPSNTKGLEQFAAGAETDDETEVSEAETQLLTDQIDAGETNADARDRIAERLRRWYDRGVPREEADRATKNAIGRADTSIPRSKARDLVDQTAEKHDLERWVTERETFDSEERGRIKHHAEQGNMGSMLRSAGVETRMNMTDDFADAGIETPRDVLDHHDENGDFTAVEGIGAKTSERLEEAVPLIREAIGDGADDETESFDHPNPTYRCNQCGDTIENSPRPLGGTCIYCGGELEMIDPGTGETGDEKTPTIYRAEKNRWPLLKPYDHQTTTVDDLPGIGKTTAKKLAAIETDVVREIAAIESTDTLAEMIDALPSGDAEETLIAAIEQSEEKHGLDGATDRLRAAIDGEPDEADESALLRTGFKKTRLVDLPGIGSGTVDKLPEGVTTVAGVTDYYRPGGPDPHPQITRRNREAIEDTLTDDQLDTLKQAIKEYAARYEWTVDFENPEGDDPDEWIDAFAVPEETDVPEYVGEWERDDRLGMKHPRWRGGTHPTRSNWTEFIEIVPAGDGRRYDVERCYRYHGDRVFDVVEHRADSVGAAIEAATEYMAANDPSGGAADEPAEIETETEIETPAVAGEHIVLVGCGKEKRDEPTAAKDLYTSSYYAKKRQWAETFGDRWYILSAEHGMIDPDETIEPYDTTIGDVDTAEWAETVLDAMPDVNGATVTLLAGADYREPISEAIDYLGATVASPFDGKPLHEQMAWLSDEIEAGETDAIETAEADALGEYIETVNGWQRETGAGVGEFIWRSPGTRSAGPDVSHETVEVRSSRGKHYLQHIKRGDDGEIVGKETIGRPRQSKQKTVDRAISYMDSHPAPTGPGSSTTDADRTLDAPEPVSGWRIADIPANGRDDTTVYARDFDDDGKIKTWIMELRATDDGYTLTGPHTDPEYTTSSTFETETEAVNAVIGTMEESPADPEAADRIEQSREQRAEREAARAEERENEPKAIGGYPNREHGSQVDYDALRRAGLDEERSNSLLDHYGSVAAAQDAGKTDVIGSIPKLGEKAWPSVEQADPDEARRILGDDSESLTDTDMSTTQTDDTDTLREQLVEMGVPGQAASTLSANYVSLAEIMDATDADLLNEEGVGPATVETIREQDDTPDLFADGWPEAIRAIRANYDDSYSSRVEVGAAIMRSVENPPSEAAGEATLQPIIRYQQTDPDDVWALLQNKHGEETALDVRRAIIEFWENSDLDEPAPGEQADDDADDSSGWVDDTGILTDSKVWKGGGGGGAEITTKPGHSGSYILTYRNFTSKAIGETFADRDDAIDHAEQVMADYSPEELAEWIDQATGAAADARADPIGTAADEQADEPDRSEGGTLRTGPGTVTLPEPWGGWDELVMVDQNAAELPTGDEGDHGIYVSADRRYGLIAAGSRASNKWGLWAIEYEPVLGDDPTPIEYLYGPGEYDGESRRERITTGNTYGSTAHKTFRENALTVEEARELFDTPEIYDPSDDMELPSAWGPNATYPTPEGELENRLAEHYGEDPDEGQWSDRDERLADKEDPAADAEFEQMVAAFESDDDADANPPEHVNGWDLDDRLGAHPRWIGGTHPTRTNWLEYVEIETAGTGQHYNVEHSYRYDGERVWEWVEQRTDTIDGAIEAAADWMEANDPSTAEIDIDDESADDEGLRSVPETVNGWTLERNDHPEPDVQAVEYEGTPEGSATRQLRIYAFSEKAEIEVGIVDPDAGPRRGGEPTGYFSHIEQIETQIDTDAAIDAAVSWMESNAPESIERPDDGLGPVELDLGSRSVANTFRDEIPDHVHADDDRRRNTVLVRRDTPKDVIDLAGTMRAEANQHNAEKYGQAELSRSERRDLESRRGWKAGNHLFHAQASKAILLGNGVDDWLSYYDHELSTDEHRQIAKQAEQDVIGERLDTDDEPAAVDQTIAEQAHTAEAGQCSHAAGHCEHGDEDACSFLKDECGYSDSEIEELQAEIEEIETEMTDMATETPDPSDVDVGEAGADLPGYALATLKRAWGGYKRAAHEAESRREAAEQYHESREEAARFGAIINEVRRKHGQEPIEISAWAGHDEPVALADLPELDEPADRGVPTDENTPGDQSVSWTQKTMDAFDKATGGTPYDPTAEFSD